VSKSSSGFNLTRLFVGSEGLLGVITKVVYRLSAKPEHETMILAGFSSLKNAIDALYEIRRSGLPLSMGELFCPNTIRLVSDYLGEQLPLVKEGVTYHLLLGCQGNGNVSEVQLARIAEIVGEFTDVELLVGQADSEKERLMKLRNNIGKALVSNGRNYRDIDASVPLSALYGYILKVGSIAVKYEVRFIFFGHALDGNLHVMLQQGNGSPRGDSEIERKALREIYAFVTDCGGVISGEHGIGALQKEFMELQYGSKNMDIMKQIKHLFDPNGILNPQKVLE
jgi:glycolate oxidase